jgi:hypothetical protein
MATTPNTAPSIDPTSAPVFSLLLDCDGTDDDEDNMLTGLVLDDAADVVAECPDVVVGSEGEGVELVECVADGGEVGVTIEDIAAGVRLVFETASTVVNGAR